MFRKMRWILNDPARSSSDFYRDHKATNFYPVLRYRCAVGLLKLLAAPDQRKSLIAVDTTKIFWGQVLLVSITVLAFVWAATEWTAWKLGFQPGLGHPWFDLFGWQVYHATASFC